MKQHNKRFYHGPPTSYEPMPSQKPLTVNSPVLTDQNYYGWSKSVERSLRTKGLVKHIHYSTPYDYYQEIASDEDEDEIEEKENVVPRGKEPRRERREAALEVEKKEGDSVDEEETSVEEKKKVPSISTKKEREFQTKQSTLESKKVKLTRKEKEKWLEDDEKAIGIIVSTITHRFQLLVQQKESCYEVWRILKEEAQKKNTGARIGLVSRFFNIRMEETEKPTTFIDRLTATVDRCREAGVKVEEEWVCYKILSSLPPRYDTVIQTCIFIEEEELTTEMLRQKLLTLEETRNLHHQERRKEEVRGREREGVVNEIRTEKISCYACGKAGHYAKDCRSPEWMKDKHRESRQKNREEERKPTKKEEPPRREEKKYEKKEDNSKKGIAKEAKGEAWLLTITDDSTTPEVERGKCMRVRLEEESDKWYLDSGCTEHLTNKEENLITQEEMKMHISGASGETIALVDKKGEVRLRCEETERNIRLQQTLLVNNLAHNLVSVRRLCENEGVKIVFKGDEVRVIKNGEEVITGKVDDTGLYNLNVERRKEEIEEGIVEELKGDKLWHERLGHLSKEYLDKMKKEGIIEEIETKHKRQECEVCDKGKMTRKRFEKETKIRTTEVGQLIHTDVCGPIKPLSYRNNKYFVTFTDDYTRMTWVAVIERKNEVIEKFKEFRKMLKTQYNKEIKRVRSD
jgi:gag-polypeptide of LTR copia-type/GAG-pre-integrase domain/Zinc knuckle